MIIADFISDVQLGEIPVAINFMDLSSGPVIEWQWNFGDGSYSTEQNPQHIYYRGGYYTVGLRVSDGAIYDNIIRYQYIHILTDSIVSITRDFSVPEDNIEVSLMLARESTNFLLIRKGIKVFEFLGQDDSLPAGFSRPMGPSILFD